MNINIHPADELAAIREEIKQLQAREAHLRAELLQGTDEERDGVQHRAVVQASTRETIDKDAIIMALGRVVVEPFIRRSDVKTLRIVEKQR